MNPHGLPNMTKPDMVLVTEAGLLPELTGGTDLLAELREEVEAAKEGD